MVETRRTTRRDVQRELRSIVRTQAPKTNGLAPTSRQAKRKATQETAEKGEASAKGKGKKRAKKDNPSYLQRSHDAENDPNRSIRLLTIPIEVFEEITSWLEPDALTCLSLTCKEILSIAGREPWTECRSKRPCWDEKNRSYSSINFRQSLIPLLGRDAPHLTVCNLCITLHPPLPPLKPPREYRETKSAKYCFGWWSIIDYLPHDEHGNYNLLWEHVAEARKSLTLGSTNAANTVGSPIELLNGNFTVRYKRLDYTLLSSGRQIGKNLILKHQHIFHSINPRSPLQVADIVNLPVRLCPHQTTSTNKPKESRYTKSRLPSGLLFHSIAAATPASLLTGIPPSSMFNPPVSSEQKQMDSVVSGIKTLWTCRACPTKWHVRHSAEGGGEFKVTSWHSFGDTPWRAQEYWKMLVRREMSNLGDEKRNSEFFVTTKQYLDFEIDDED